MAPRNSIPALVRHLRSGNAAAQATAAAALSTLAFRSLEDRAAIVAAGGVEAISQYARSSSATTQGKLAGAALVPLSWEPAGAAAVLAAGAVPFLVAMLGTSASDADFEDTFLNVARALACMAIDSARGAAAVLDAGVLPVLVDVLQSGGPASKAAATEVLTYLGYIAGHREQLASAVPSLVQCLRHTDLSVRWNAAAALRNIADSPSRQATVLAAGGIPLLLRCMDSGIEGLQQVAVGAIGNISNQNAECSRAVVDAAGVPALLALMTSARSRTSPATAGRAVHVLLNMISLIPLARTAIVDAGGISAAAGLLTSRPELTEHATCLLSLLAGVEPARSPAIAAAIHAGGGAAAFDQLRLLSSWMTEDWIAGQPHPDHDGRP